MTSRLLLISLLASALWAARIESPTVSTIRVPHGGLQPQVVERDGVVHLVYFTGDTQAGDLFYVRSKDYGLTFSSPIPINHLKGSAIAAGNIRGAQLVPGRNGRVHVAWNQAGATPNGMLYARLNDAGTGFEAERNVIQKAYGLDGGGTLAADREGNVFIFWHAPTPGLKGEENRRVWMAKSVDDGKTFAPETAISTPGTGACGCCGMKALADSAGNLYVLYRSAKEVVNRDIWLLTSTDHGKTFKGTDISHWNVGACVMSLESIVEGPSGVYAAWEEEKQVHYGRLNAAAAAVSDVVAAPGTPQNRKYPVLAVNGKNHILFTWAEGMAWKKGGAVEWQLGNARGRAEGVPPFSLVAAFAKPDGTFAVVY